MISDSSFLTPELRKQLCKGYILADYTICTVNGAPGSGKTSFGHFVSNESLPHARISTACMEQAKRFILEIIDGQERRCRLITDTDMVDMIAENISAGVSLTKEEPIASKASDFVAENFSAGVSLTKKEPKASKASDLVEMIAENSSAGDFFTKKPSNTQDSSNQGKEAMSTKASQLQLNLTHTTEYQQSLTEKQAASSNQMKEEFNASESKAKLHETMQQKKVLPQTAKIAEMIGKLSESREVLKAHFLLLVDCGGQPQFMEMIPILMKHAYLRLFMFKLSEKLSERPEVDFYEANGKKCNLGQFTLRNEELIMKCMQMTRCQHSKLLMPFIERHPEHPKSIVIGTFKDKLEASGESLEAKNLKLAEMLKVFNKYLIKRSENEVIYAVNNTESGPGVPRDPIAEELLQVVESCGQSIRVKYPLNYYLLEVELRKVGKIVTRTDCWVIAKQLLFESEDAMDAALQFFHAIGLMFYFPTVAKDVVFVDPMSLMDWLTNIFKKSIHVMDEPECNVISEEMIRLRDQALLTTSILESLQSNEASEGAKVPVNNLINLLQHLLIIAPIQKENNTNYFMPSLLDDCSDKSTSSEPIQPSSGDPAPLHITFSSLTTPSGLLSCLLVYLSSSQGKFQWQIPAHQSEESTRLFKNKVHFTLAEYGGGITFVADDTCYSVYADSQCSPKLLPLIWDDINQGISKVCDHLSISVDHSVGFQCLCPHPSFHLAVVSSDHKSWVCSNSDVVTGTLSDKQKLWLLKTMEPVAG